MLVQLTARARHIAAAADDGTASVFSNTAESKRRLRKGRLESAAASSTARTHGLALHAAASSAAKKGVGDGFDDVH